MLINFPYIERDLCTSIGPTYEDYFAVHFYFIVTQTSNFWFILTGLILAIIYYSGARLTWAETKTAWIYIFVLSLIRYLSLFSHCRLCCPGSRSITSAYSYRLPFFSYQRFAICWTWCTDCECREYYVCVDTDYA